MLKLRFRNNKHNGVWLVEPKVTIGRSPGNDLLIEGPAVADMHAEILVSHEQLTLVNTSGKALLVNNEPVETRRELAVNDHLLVGGLALEVVDPKQEQRRAASSGESENTGWALKANHTALANRVFPIRSETVIGRSTDCDISLAAAHLSRRHVKLFVEDGLLYVRDLGSANGTFLNGERVNEARVRRGDELRFDTLSFGVIGPPSEDLDKTSIRPLSAVKLPAANKAAAPRASAVRSTRAHHADRFDAASAEKLNAAVSGDSSRGKLFWGLGLLVAIALAAGLAWQQGLLGQ